MTNHLTPKDKVKALQVLRNHLPSIGFFKQKPGAKNWLDEILAQAEELCVEPVDFMWCAGGRFTINGVPVPFTGKGLTLAWLTLASTQCRLDPLCPEFLGKGWRGSARQSLDRAEDAVKAISPKLASVIREIGLQRGELVLKSNPQVRVICSLDNTLTEAFRRLA